MDLIQDEKLQGVNLENLPKNYVKTKKQNNLVAPFEAIWLQKFQEKGKEKKRNSSLGKEVRVLLLMLKNKQVPND